MLPKSKERGLHVYTKRDLAAWTLVKLQETGRQGYKGHGEGMASRLRILEFLVQRRCFRHRELKEVAQNVVKTVEYVAGFLVRRLLPV